MKGSKQDYILKVSAGPDYDSLSVIEVNDEENPAFINSTLFSGFLLVRIADFNGVTKRMESTKSGDLHFPIQNPPSGYFAGKNRRYSLVVQGRFKHSYDGDEVIFGIDSNAPLAPITGISIGLRISKWLDPTLEADLSGSNPHMYSPLVSGINSLAVFSPFEKVGGKAIGTVSMENVNYLGSPVSNTSSSPTKDTPSFQRYHRESNPNVIPKSPSNDSPTLSSIAESTRNSLSEDSDNLSIDTQSPLDCQQWAFATTNVPDKSSLLFNSPLDIKQTHPYQKRKSFLTKPSPRKKITFSPENIYAIDFYDCYFEHEKYQLHLPGFSLDGFQYWDGKQPLRYVCKTRKEKVFFVFSFEWVKRSNYPGLKDYDSD